jgi:hypothetical protein
MREKSMNELERLKRLLEADLQSLIELTFTLGPTRERHIRQASVIIRRWLLDNDLNKLSQLLGATATFPVVDDRHLFEAAKNDPDIDYYLSAGVKFNGQPVMQLYASRAPNPPDWVRLWPSMQVADLRLGKAISRPALYFEGETFNLGEVVKFACNKLGGAHHDDKRTAREEKLERAANHLTIGPPADTAPQDQVGETHLPLEEIGADVLSGIAVSVMVAATMLVNIRFDGIPVLDFGGQ